MFFSFSGILNIIQLFMNKERRNLTPERIREMGKCTKRNDKNGMQLCKKNGKFGEVSRRIRKGAELKIKMYK